MNDYEIRNQKILEASNKYCNLDLKNFIKNVFLECGYDLKRMDNVYIDELVEAPNVWGCLKKGDEFITYYTFENAILNYKVYKNPNDFIWSFLTNCNVYSKYEPEDKKSTQ